MRISGFAGWNRFADSKRRREGASKQTAEQTREPEGREPVFNNTNMEPTSRADAVRRSTGQVRRQSSSHGAHGLPLWVGQFRPHKLAYEKQTGSLIRVENPLDESLGEYAETENWICSALG